MVKRQRVPVQINQFVGGINTEANPLSFPEGASLDETNMDFNRDGSRSRRNGFDVEPDFQINDTGIATQPDLKMAHSQFRWTNPGGKNNAEFLVVQVGNCLRIHDLNIAPLSSTNIYTKIFADTTYDTTFAYAVVDGSLVVATGEDVVYSFNYDGSYVTYSVAPLLIRDLFGVSAWAGGVELTAQDNIQVRPTTLTSTHLYNLRNQTFALPRVSNQTDTDFLLDIVADFYSESPSNYPSNADNAVTFTYPNAEQSLNREVDRFYPAQMKRTLPSNTQAPIGYFIINALKRGASRLEQEQKLRDSHPDLSLSVSNLKSDITEGGASVLAQYSGRVWYAGFSADVVDGDKKSPRLSSYVLFSQVVRNPTDFNKCYQAADPTSIDDPDLVDTDGGFLKVDGAYNIQALVPVDSSLFVIAENGVWRVVGTDDNTFTATGYSVYKITEEGCISPRSVVVSGNSFSYWGENSIYGVSRDQTGDWVASNITESTIQTYYNDISAEAKTTSSGYYDSENSTVRWVWGEVSQDAETSNELILNLRDNAFTKNVINLPASISGIVSVSGGQVPTSSTSETVTTNSLEVITSDGEDVTITPISIQRGVTTAFYTVLINYEGEPTYSFGRYNRPDTTYDWTRFGDPTDSPALIIGGSVTGGDARLRKNVPYLSVYFKEPDTYETTSQCILTAQWDWTTNYELGKWSSPRQIYRPSRYGNQGGILPTRNKIRGSGRSVAFKLESVEGATMHVYGWEYNIEANSVE